MQTIRFDWSEKPAPAGPDELVLTLDPLAEKPYSWFEDYFDYPGRFKEIYSTSKQKSTTWCDDRPFSDISILGVPYLVAFEHQVHSFWMQVERDNELIENLIKKEQPEKIVLSGVQPDPAKIISCRFDPGIFEFILNAIARKQKIPIEFNQNNESQTSASYYSKSGWLIKILGAISAQIQAVVFKPAVDSSQKNILVSPQVFARVGKTLMAEAEKQNVAIVSTEPDRCDETASIYTLCGGRVSFFARLQLYRNAMAAFKQVPASDWSKQFTKSDIDYGPFAAQALRIGIEKYLWIECYRLLLLQTTIRKLHPLSLLVLYDHGIFEACSVQLAKMHGVKTVTLQHGISNKDIPGYTPVKSDFFACWGEQEKTTLIEQGVGPNKIIVTGYPAFDGLWQLSDNPKPAPVDRKPIRVLIATQGVKASVEWRLALTPTARIILAIIELKIPVDKYIFTFRLHPNEELSPHVKALADKAGILITKGVPLAEQFAAIDVVVTQFSTIGFEALLSGIPLVSLNWVSKNEIIPFAGSAVASFSSHVSDLWNALDDAITLSNKNQSQRHKFLQEYLCGINAGEKLIKTALIIPIF